jgi:hypothetical protein
LSLSKLDRGRSSDGIFRLRLRGATLTAHAVPLDNRAYGVVVPALKKLLLVYLLTEILLDIHMLFTGCVNKTRFHN